MAGDESGRAIAQSDGEMIAAEYEGQVVEGDWRGMKKFAQAILDEAEKHKTDLQKAEEMGAGIHVRAFCEDCDVEREFEYVTGLRNAGWSPEEHADTYGCSPDDVTIEAFCPRHGTVPLDYDRCDECADARAVMNR
jgi:hypothetical protein